MKIRIVILCLFAGTTLSVAQPLTGAISGRVTSAATGEGLAGANLVIEGTFLGTASDAQGRFVIRRVPPGEYRLACSMVGYQRIVTPGVRVRAADTTVVTVVLPEHAIETAPVVITASRREQRLRDVPVSMSTVSAEEIMNRNAVTLDEVIRTVPGVHFMQDQVNIRGSSGYSRGVGSRVLLLLDGMPYLTGDTGEINWEAIPAQEVERVEIVKGAGSALYGSSALGGVINVITKGIPDGTRVGFHMFGGLYGRPRYADWVWSSQPRATSAATVSLSQRFGSFAYLASIRRSADDSYRANDAFHRWNVYTKLRYDFASVRSLTVTANLLLRHHGNFFWWRSLQEATRPADIQLNGHVLSHRGNVGLTFKEFLSESSFYMVKALYFGNFWKDDSAGHVNNVSASHSFHGEFQLTYQIAPHNILTTGLAGYYDRVTSNLFGKHPGGGLAVYAQEEVTPIDPLQLTLGIRIDAERVSILPAATRVSPKIAALYKLTPSTNLRASFGMGFRYPSIGELYVSSSTNVSQLIILPNPNLRPESSVTGEVGVTQELGDLASMEFALFNNDFKDLIEAGVEFKTLHRSPSDTVPRPVATFANVTRARIQGFELGVNVEWIRHVLSMTAGYTYVWPEDLDQHKVLKFRPRHLVNASARLTLWNLETLVDFRYSSRVERIDEDLVRLAPIIDGDQRVPIRVVDLRLLYPLTSLGLPLRAGFSVRNLFDYYYVELIGNLSPIRTFVVSLEGTF